MLPNRVGAAFVLVVLLVCGCGSTATSRAQVETETLDVCQGVTRYSAIDEPDPRDAEVMREYAEAFASILEHVDTSLEHTDGRGNRVKASEAVIADITTMRRSMTAFRAGVRQPASEDQVRKAQATLAADARYTEADRRLQVFSEKGCE